MKSSVLLSFIFLAIALQGGHCKYQYKTEYFDVLIDHFNFNNNDHFKIKYLINDSYVINDNGPIFFYTGNEGSIELFAENTGFMWEIAHKFNALLVFAEHRYYGTSLPFGNKSYDGPDHLGYLTSEQALADYADLLEFLKVKTLKRPVITFGGSYGGMLAGWMRMKYPHLITGAIASSAPILQFTNITPCGVFNRILTSVFNTAYNEECVTNIRKSWNILKTSASTPEGRAMLNAKFEFCQNLTKPEDIENFFSYLNDVYANIAMVNYPYPSSFLAPLPAYPVREFCWRMKNHTVNDSAVIDKLYDALSIYSNYTGGLKCLDISDAFDDSMGTKGWDFQACTEMVMPMCADGKNDMFQPTPWNLKEFSDNCFKKFKVRPRENAAITYYGGPGLEAASNIVFSNGLLDPWTGGGVLRSPNDKVEIITIPDAAHHLDLRASNPNDPQSVKSARGRYMELIKQWIKEHMNRAF